MATPVGRAFHEVLEFRLLPGARAVGKSCRWKNANREQEKKKNA